MNLHLLTLIALCHVLVTGALTCPRWSSLCEKAHYHLHINEEAMQLGKSLIKTKRSGPGTVPWGTLGVTGSRGESTPLKIKQKKAVWKRLVVKYGSCRWIRVATFHVKMTFESHAGWGENVSLIRENAQYGRRVCMFENFEWEASNWHGSIVVR